MSEKKKRGRKKIVGKRYTFCLESPMSDYFDEEIGKKGKSAQMIIRDVLHTYFYLDGNTMKESVQFVMEKDEYSLLKERAESKGLSIDDYIRGILRSVL